MVVLGLKSHEHLLQWEIKLKDKGLKYYKFEEDDINNEGTSIAIEPLEDGSIFKELRLL